MKVMFENLSEVYLSIYVKLATNLLKFLSNLLAALYNDMLILLQNFIHWSLRHNIELFFFFFVFFISDFQLIRAVHCKNLMQTHVIG